MTYATVKEMVDETMWVIEHTTIKETIEAIIATERIAMAAAWKVAWSLETESQISKMCELLTKGDCHENI